VKRDAALGRALYVSAAHENLRPLSQDAPDGGQEHLRRHPLHHVVLPREQPREEREGVAGILLRRERRRHVYSGGAAVAESALQLRVLLQEFLVVRARRRSVAVQVDFLSKFLNREITFKVQGLKPGAFTRHFQAQCQVASTCTAPLRVRRVRPGLGSLR
jgi:hypothetical protein